MLNTIETMLSYAFIRNALIAGIALAISSALVGIPLVLKGKSMLSDGLSHASFGAVAIALVAGIAPTWFALGVSILASFLIFKMGEKNKDKNNDALIAVISSSALAIGMIMLSLKSVISIDPNAYLFGSILSISKLDMTLAIILAILTILAYVVFYKQIFAVTFDPEFASATGINTKLYDAMLAIVCSAVVVLGMKICGALLVSAFIVMPVLGGIKIAKNFKTAIIVSTILSLIAFIVGFIASYMLSLPTGATIVVAELIFLILAATIAKI